MNLKLFGPYIFNKLYKPLKLIDAIFVESFYGKEISGDAKYLAIKMNKISNYPVFIVYENDLCKKQILELGFVPIKLMSRRYFSCINTCKYIITNLNLYKLIKPKKKQVVIEVWHGFPIKKMVGRLEEKNKAAAEFDQFSVDMQKWTHLLSGTETYFSKLEKNFGSLNHVKKISGIMPRHEFLIENCDNLEKIVEIKEKYNISGKEIILYCPTWRNDESQNKFLNLKELLNYLPEYEFLVKLHPHSVISNFVINDSIKFFQNIDIYELLLISDIMITDYSSIAIDFLTIKDKIIFHSLDLDSYSNSVGIDLNLSVLGDYSFNNAEPRELATQIKLGNYGKKSSYICDHVIGNKTIDYDFYKKE